MRGVGLVVLLFMTIVNAAGAATCGTLAAMRGPAIGRLVVAPGVSLIRTRSALTVAAAAPSDVAASPTSCGCAVTGRAPAEHDGPVVATTGFTTPLRAMLASSDDDGVLRHVEIPGFLTAALRREGDWSTAVSVAADSNAPATRHAVMGCLGSGAAALRLFADPAHPGRRNLSWRIGDGASATALRRRPCRRPTRRCSASTRARRGLSSPRPRSALMPWALAAGLVSRRRAHPSP